MTQITFVQNAHYNNEIVTNIYRKKVGMLGPASAYLDFLIIYLSETGVDCADSINIGHEKATGNCVENMRPQLLKLKNVNEK